MEAVHCNSKVRLRALFPFEVGLLCILITSLSYISFSRLHGSSRIHIVTVYLFCVTINADFTSTQSLLFYTKHLRKLLVLVCIVTKFHVTS